MDACLERLAMQFNGYLSDVRELDSPNVIAVFSSPEDAVGWALACRCACLAGWGLKRTGTCVLNETDNSTFLGDFVFWALSYRCFIL
jgi:hypothetical protein